MKKWLKRWAAKARLALLIPPLARPNYVCAKCGKREGMYSAVGRNLFPVEPMPPGALPIYDRPLPDSPGKAIIRAQWAEVHGREATEDELREVMDQAYRETSGWPPKE